MQIEVFNGTFHILLYGKLVSRDMTCNAAASSVTFYVLYILFYAF